MTALILNAFSIKPEEEMMKTAYSGRNFLGTIKVHLKVMQSKQKVKVSRLRRLDASHQNKPI